MRTAQRRNRVGTPGPGLMRGKRAVDAQTCIESWERPRRRRRSKVIGWVAWSGMATLLADIDGMGVQPLGPSTRLRGVARPSGSHMQRTAVARLAYRDA